MSQRKREYGPRTDEPRTERIAIRLTAAELAALRDAADAHGYTMGGYLRQAAAAVKRDGELRDERADQRELAREIRGMRGDLGRLGNNVNQIARVLNATGKTQNAGYWSSVLPVLQTMQEALLKLGEREKGRD